MRKLLTSLATVVLLMSSTMNVIALPKQIAVPFTDMKMPTKRQQKAKQNNHRKGYFNTTNEDAEDIADKLWNKTIKIDPNIFLNKNLHTDKKQFNDQIVKQGILIQAEVQYVSWGSLNINVARFYADSAHFTVNKDGAIATGTDSVDASLNETTAQVAAKLANKDINLNFSYWNGKEINPNLGEIRSIIANEKLLTKAEASIISGISAPIKISGPDYISVTFVLNDSKTTANAKNHFSVNDDGKDAS